MDEKNIIYRYWNKAVQERIAVFCCLSMIAGLFFSRAILSMSMLLMMANALYPPMLKRNFELLLTSKFAWFSFSFFAIYLISGLWSDNHGFWWDSTVNKVPFVILPFAFLSVPLHKATYQRIIIGGILGMQLLVVFYSIGQLAFHPDFYIKGYQFSRPLPTTKYNDHIRFSLSLVLSMLLICYLLIGKREQFVSRWLKAFLISTLVLFTVYLHLLAAKSGLICFYLSAFIFILYVVGKKNRFLSIVLAAIVVLMPVVAYEFVPTFHTKIDYVYFEISKSREEKHYDYTLSDAGRMITYRIGNKLIAAHPVAGVGAGDLMDEMRKGYKAYYPEVALNQQYGPINQFMFTALSVGIPLTLFLVLMVLAPFFIVCKKRIYLLLTAMIMLVSLMVESALEVQFGVFTFLFFILLWLGMLEKKHAEQLK